MQSLLYQRPIVGYHGCDLAVVEKVLLNRASLEPSENDHDWLGAGIYFWEYGSHRALDWADDIARRRPNRVKTPAVIGAHIHLGVCFDLLDIRSTEILADLYPSFVQTLEKQGIDIPQNQAAHGNDRDFVRRNLDCAMLNWAIPVIEKELGVRFQTVRGVFQEGIRVYPGSGIFRESHIQVAVRDKECILGYFLPET